MRVKAFRPWIETRIFEETFPGENHKLKHIIENLPNNANVMLQLTEAGQTGVHPGLPAVPPVVRESSSVGENVPSQLPGTEERTALRRCSGHDLVTLALVSTRH